jgi:protein-disulfide isomerase
MPSDASSHVPEPQDRREAVREKAQQVQQQQSRARAVRRSALLTGAFVVVAAVVVAVTWAVQSAVTKPQLSPANATDGGFAVTAVTGVAGTGGGDQQPLATVSASPTASPSPTATASPSPTAAPGVVDIRVYVDYLAPGAKQFQLSNDAQLSTWVSQNAATLTYYPVAMLTPKSNGTKYSLRAASAAACVATHSPKAFFAYTTALLTQQPDQGSDGLTDAQLADLAQASGVDAPKTVRDCIENEDYADWAKAATDRALQGLPGTKGVALTATPMILVNGQPYQGALDNPKEFAQFVLTISSDSYYSSPSPTPSGSATPTPTP